MGLCEDLEVTQWQEHGGGGGNPEVAQRQENGGGWGVPSSKVHPPHVISVLRYGGLCYSECLIRALDARSIVQIHIKCPPGAIDATTSSFHTMVMGGLSVHEFRLTNNLAQEKILLELPRKLFQRIFYSS